MPFPIKKSFVSQILLQTKSNALQFSNVTNKMKQLHFIYVYWILNSCQHGRKEEKLHYMIQKSSSEKTRGKWWKHITNQQGLQYRQGIYSTLVIAEGFDSRFCQEQSDKYF